VRLQMNSSSKINIVKRCFKKLLLLVFAVILLGTTSTEIKTISHIPLKGLFEVLKYDDIGFAHALLHSGWIENMYQYGAGKPHREIEIKNRKKLKTQDKGDAVANLIRKFWFRRSENHHLLLTQFGCLANIPNAQLGKVFGQLINYIYRGSLRDEPNGSPQDDRGENQDKLIDAIFACDPQADQFKQEFAALWRDVIDQGYKLKHGEEFAAVRDAKKKFQETVSELEKKYKMMEFNQRIAEVSAKCKKNKNLSFKEERLKIESEFDKRGYAKALKEAKRNIFEGVDQEILDEYQQVQAAVSKMEKTIAKKMKQKREPIRRNICDPIKKALEFCKTGRIYMTRTPQAILWALFFHKIDSFASQQEQIQAINDCLNSIDKEFKNEKFYGHIMLKDLYYPRDFDSFGRKIGNGRRFGNVPMRQVCNIDKNYDIALHYFVSLVAGKKFPPVIGQGDYGYEYEAGKISYERPDCHETVTLDLLSIFWYNPVKKAYDDSMLPEKVIKNGEGLKKLREALKYFYLADSKGIKADEYTNEFKGKKFTSITKLKNLGRISVEEVKKLDISEVPVSYITRSEVKQEFFNIVSGIPGVIYCSQVKDKEIGFELETDVRNLVKIFNYFYGTDIKDIVELGDKDKGISTENRGIIFEKQSEKNTPNEITVSVDYRGNNNYFDVTLNVGTYHTSLTFPARAKRNLGILKLEALGVILRRVALHKNERFIPFLSLIAPIRLVIGDCYGRTHGIYFSLPTLNLIYYSLLLRTPENKLEVLEHVLVVVPEYYDSLREMIYNVIDAFPSNDQYLKYHFIKTIIKSGFCEKEPFFKEYVQKVLDDPGFYGHDFNDNCIVSDHYLIDLIKLLLKKGYKDLVLKIVTNSKFDAGLEGVLYPLEIALGLQSEEYQKIVLAIVQNPTFNATERGVGILLASCLKLALVFENKEYTTIATAIIDNSAFDGWIEAADFAFKKGWNNIALDIINNPKFGFVYDDSCLKDASALLIVLKIFQETQDIRCKNVAEKIMNNPKFKHWGGVVEFALQGGYKEIAWEVVKHPRFFPGHYRIWHALKSAIKNPEHRELVLRIVNHSAFDINTCSADRFLNSVKNLKEQSLDRKQELQEIIDIIENKQSKKDSKN